MVTAAIVGALILAVAIAIRRILFAIGKGLCWIVGFLNDVFDMVAGLKNITYQKYTSMPLINVFFNDTNINTIYWGMALIGIVMCFGFAIFAVIRKSGDLGDKVKQSLGDILRNCFKGIVLILLMNFIMSATISITTTLLDRINYLIVNAQNFDLSYDVTFTSTDYAAMGRCLNTIGNYSINSSYNSRYNLNSCYNSIRPDLKQLADDGKFEVTYITTVHENGTARTANTWQSVLQNIYRSVDDINVPQPLDEYNTKLADSLLDAMDIIRNDASFEALEKYHVDRSSKTVGENVHLDRMIMLIGSMYGTGSSISKGTGFTDYLRGPYYYGDKELFDYDVVSMDFDMSVGTWLYLTVIVVAFLFIKEMLAMVFNAGARIFNMLILYVSAPPFIAVTPLDDGGKLKQWTTAFIIQSLGLFGTVISLRLVMMFIPMIFSGDIQFFESARMDTFTRVIIMYAAIYTSRKASGMIVGILADNAGYQAIQAGDVGSEARSAIETGVGLGKMLGGFAVGVIGKGLSKADAAVDKKKAAKEQAGKEKGGKGDGSKTAKLGNGNPPQNMLDVGSKTSASLKGAASSGANQASNGARGGGKAAAGSGGSASAGAKQGQAAGGVPENKGASGPSSGPSLEANSNQSANAAQNKGPEANPNAGGSNIQLGNNPGNAQVASIPSQINPPDAQPDNSQAGQSDDNKAVQPGNPPAGQPGVAQAVQPGNNSGSSQGANIPSPVKAPVAQPDNSQANQSSNNKAAQPGNPPAGQPGVTQAVQPSAAQPNQAANNSGKAQSAAIPAPVKAPVAQQGNSQANQPSDNKAAQPGNNSGNSQGANLPSPVKAPVAQPGNPPAVQPAVAQPAQPGNPPAGQPVVAPAVQPSVAQPNQAANNSGKGESAAIPAPVKAPVAQQGNSQANQPSDNKAAQPGNPPANQQSEIQPAQSSNISSNQSTAPQAPQPNNNTGNAQGTNNPAPAKPPVPQPAATVSTQPSAQPNQAALNTDSTQARNNEQPIAYNRGNYSEGGNKNNEASSASDNNNRTIPDIFK